MVLQNIDYANNKCSIHFLTARKLEISSQVIVRWPSLVGIDKPIPALGVVELRPS